MDYAAFHKTSDILNKLKEYGVDVAMIPPGLTGLL